jgi:hypothetical protein
MKQQWLLAAGILVAALVPLTSEAATFTVTTDADSGPGSLRQAILDANANAEADTIDFDADYTIVLQSRLPDITTDIEITGNGWDRTILDGGNPPGGSTGVEAFWILTGGILTVDGVMIQNCYGGGGGAVKNVGGTFRFRNSRCERNRSDYGGCYQKLGSSGSTEIEDSVIADNMAVSAGGGIFYSGSGSLRIARSAIVGNVGCEENWFTWRGGGVFVRYSASVHISDSVIADNVCDSVLGGPTEGGGLAMTSSGGVVLANCTISGNYADRGGGIYLDPGAGPADFQNVTIASNTGGEATGGVFIGNPGNRSRNSIFAGNIGGNCWGAHWIDSEGYNIEDADTCLNWTPDDQVYTNPSIGPLGDNGGPTATHALLPGSPAIEAGNPAGCVWDDDGLPGTPDVPLDHDQRGYVRPFDGGGGGTPICDIGAYESGVVYRDDFESGDTSGWSLTVP